MDKLLKYVGWGKGGYVNISLDKHKEFINNIQCFHEDFIQTVIITTMPRIKNVKYILNRIHIINYSNLFMTKK